MSKHSPLYTPLHDGEAGYRCEVCRLEYISPVSLWEHLQDHRDHGVTVELSELAQLEAAVLRDHSYDQRSFELATHFLSDYSTTREFDRTRLAQHIQDAIEEWLRTEGLKS